jgi:hypothetical protein
VIAGTAIAAALAGIFLFGLDFAGPIPVLVLAGFYGALTYPIYGLAVAQANDYTDPGDFVAVSGGLLLSTGSAPWWGRLPAAPR